MALSCDEPAKYVEKFLQEDRPLRVRQISPANHRIELLWKLSLERPLSEILLDLNFFRTLHRPIQMLLSNLDDEDTSTDRTMNMINERTARSGTNGSFLLEKRPISGCASLKPKSSSGKFLDGKYFLRRPQGR